MDLQIWTNLGRRVTELDVKMIVVDPPSVNVTLALSARTRTSSGRDMHLVCIDKKKQACNLVVNTNAASGETSITLSTSPGPKYQRAFTAHESESHRRALHADARKVRGYV